MERFIALISITMGLFIIGYAGSAAITTRRPEPTPIVQRPLDAKALARKLETLDARLKEAQASIDEVLGKLSNAHEESVVEATRIRLDTLYRLESGLVSDIARTRERLQSLTGRGVE